MKKHIESETEDSSEDSGEELSFTEAYSRISPQSDYAIFVFTYIGIIIGIMFSTIIDPLLMGGYNVGRILSCIVFGEIGFRFGRLVKQAIDCCN